MTPIHFAREMARLSLLPSESMRHVVPRSFPQQHRSYPRPGMPVVELSMTELQDAVTFGFAQDDVAAVSLFFFTCFGERSPLGKSEPAVLSKQSVAAIGRLAGWCRAEDSLIRIAHGWYATRELSDWETLRALMQIVPEDTVVAGETAAILYGIELRPTSSYQTPFKVCVARPEGNRAIRRPGIRCRVLQMEKGDSIVKYGIRCTSPLRTALDLAATSTIEITTHVIELFLRKGLVTYDQLWRRVEALKGTRGCRTVRAAVINAKPQSESVFETAVRLRLEEAGLISPVPQVPVRIAGRKNPVRIDLGWEKYEGRQVKLGLECDSWKHHPETGPKAVADQERREKLGNEGWKILRIRFHELYGLQFTFERSVARILHTRVRTQERARWHFSRWNHNRNAWVRSEAKQRRVK